MRVRLDARACDRLDDRRLAVPEPRRAQIKPARLAACTAADALARLQADHVHVLLAQHLGGGEPGDPGAHDDNVGRVVHADKVGRPSSVRRVGIDHVIYAAEDVEAAASRLAAQLGLPTVPGGRHEGHGTHNVLVPLGGGYLEVLGVADEAEAQTSDFGRGLLARLERSGEGWLTWVVAVSDVDAVAGRLGTPITTLRREGLSARLTGVAQAMSEPYLPFFVSRDPGVADPGENAEGDGISWLELAGDVARLERWLDSAPLPVRVVDGAPELRAVGIGDAVLR
jgi:hypothetical protein